MIANRSSHQVLLITCTYALENEARLKGFEVLLSGGIRVRQGYGLLSLLGSYNCCVRGLSDPGIIEKLPPLVNQSRISYNQVWVSTICALCYRLPLTRCVDLSLKLVLVLQVLTKSHLVRRGSDTVRVLPTTTSTTALLK